MKIMERTILLAFYLSLIFFISNLQSQNCAEPNVLYCSELGCATNWFCDSYLYYFQDCIIHCYDNILYHRIFCIEFY